MIKYKLLLFIYVFCVHIVYCQSCVRGDDSPDSPSPDIDLYSNYADSISIDRVHSLDPNLITGPLGYDSLQWMSVKDNFGYTVYFENDPDFATAPAQVVIIDVPVDSHFNIQSVRLGDFGFGYFNFSVPENTSFYQERLNVLDSLNVYVDVTAGVDVVNKKVFWIFESIDSLTGLPPEDALTGFLAVGDTSVTIYNDTLPKENEGYVNFRIYPQETLLTGDSVQAQASIVFDINEPLITNIWRNKIDAFGPTSLIDSGTLVSNSIYLNWSGVDDPGGVGINHYDLYVSINSGPFLALAENVDTTAFVYNGLPGNTYSFYTIATDHVGNTEDRKTEGDVTITINHTTGPTAECPEGGDLGINPPTIAYAANDDPVWSDSCNFTTGKIEGIPTGDGCSFTVTHKYWLTDECNNTDTCFQTFNWIMDTIPPTAICIDGEDLGLNPPASAYAANDIPEWYDLCGFIYGVVEGTPVLDGCIYIVTHKYWATDPYMNNDTCYQTFTWMTDADGIPPVPDVTNLPDVVEECQADLIAPTATDNCAGVINASTNDSTFYQEEGTYIVIWTYDDGNGNLVSQFQTVTIDDTTPPIPDVMNLPDIVGSCSVMVEPPTATDNCAGSVTATTDDPVSYTSPGTYTIEWTYDDGNGNITNQMQNVILESSIDTISPVADVLALPDVVEACSAVLSPPTATDNCAGVVMGSTSDPTEYAEQGTYVVSWTYDDGNGNTTMQLQNVIINDTVAPVPDVVALPDAIGDCNISVTAPFSTDNCAGSVMATTNDPVSYTSPGTYTIEWTYDDGNGNITNQMQNVILESSTDTISPVADVLDLPDAVEACSAVLSPPTATDNCAGVVMGSTSDPTEYAEQGTYVVSWTYDDGNGNTTMQLQNVIINDTVAPVPDVVDLPDVTGDCSISVTAPFSTDNCGGSVMATTDDPVSYTSPGTYTIEWTYDDGNGNITNQMQNVILGSSIDTISPVADVLTLPDVVEACSAVLSPPTATDNCAGVVMGSTSDPTEYAEQGTYVVTWTYDDGNGNTTMQLQNVIINDTVAPVPDVVALPDAIGDCNISVTAPFSTDNCGGSVMATTDDPVSYTLPGTYTIEWTYDDGNGNINNQTQNIIVNDETPPVPVVADLPDIIVDCEVTLDSPIAVDNCGGTITATTTDPIHYDVQGSFVVSWVYDDGNGNTSSQQQDVTVNDTIAPQIIIPNDTTVEATTGLCGAWVDYEVLGVDNCTVEGLSQIMGIESGGFFPTGTTMNTYEITDAGGNTTTASFSVSVVDNEPPTLVCPADMLLCEGDIVNYSIPTGMDNCEVASLVQTDTSGLSSGMEFPIGETPQVFTAIDAFGNTGTCSFNVAVNASPGLSIVDSLLPAFCQGGDYVLSVDAPTAEMYQWSTNESSSNISVFESGIYSVTIEDSNGCEGEESIQVDYDTSKMLSSYLMLAMDRVELEKDSIFQGGVGILSYDRKVKVKNETKITAPGTFVQSPVIDINGGSEVNDTTLAIADVSLPLFYPNPYSSNNNITIQDDETLILQDSIYGKVELKENATAIFIYPNYYIKELKVRKENATLLFDTCSNVLITKKLELDKYTTVNPTHEWVVFYVEEDIRIDEGTMSNGVMFSLKKLDVKKADPDNPTKMSGMFIADKVESGEYVNWHWNTSCEPCSVPPVAPFRFCACEDGIAELSLIYDTTDVAALIEGLDDDGDLLNSYANVEEGDTLYFSSTTLNKDEIGNNFELIVDGEIFNINTSCSDPIQGLSFGPVTVIGYVDKSNNKCNMDAGPVPIQALLRRGSKSENGLNITVYPNPFEESIVVEGRIPEDDQEAIISVMDPLGRTIKSVKITTTENKHFKQILFTDDLPPSIYFIMVQTRSAYQLKKVIKGS